MNAPDQRQAVHAWLAYRDARHAAGGLKGRDPLRTMLGAFFVERRLPPVDRLSGDQADEVLDKITEFEWNQRPF